jgi:hypothetical protein
VFFAFSDNTDSICEIACSVLTAYFMYNFARVHLTLRVTPAMRLEWRTMYGASRKYSVAWRPRHASREAAMQEISTRQKVLLRAIVLVIILVVLAMFGLLRRNAPIVY